MAQGSRLASKRTDGLGLNGLYLSSPPSFRPEWGESQKPTDCRNEKSRNELLKNSQIGLCRTSQTEPGF